MIWLVVLTILKNTSQIGLLFPIYGKRVPNHQPEYDPFFAKSTVAGIVTWSMHGMIILNHRSKAMRQSQLPIINQHQLVGGIPTPLKNMKVTWDDDSQYMEIHKIHVPNHQPVHCGLLPRYWKFISQCWLMKKTKGTGRGDKRRQPSQVEPSCLKGKRWASAWVTAQYHPTWEAFAVPSKFDMDRQVMTSFHRMICSRRSWTEHVQSSNFSYLSWRRYGLLWAV